MAGLPATPWLDSHPGDTAQHYTQGYGLGLSSATEQARVIQQQQQLAQQQAQMQQQAQQHQMQMEQQQKEHERSFLMEQQQMEIGKQYHQMQMGLAQQKLEEAKKMGEAKMQQFVQKAAAMQEANQRIEAGEDPGKVWLDVGLRAGLNGTAVASLNRSQGAQAYTPESMKIEGQTMYRGAPAGEWKPLHAGSTASPPEKVLDMDEYKKLNAQKLKIQGELAIARGDSVAGLQDDFNRVVRRQRQLQQSLGIAAPSDKTSAATSGQKLDETTAMWFLNESQGDKEKARQMAKDAGYNF